MCHSEEIQERFYALHKNVERGRRLNKVFTNLSFDQEAEEVRRRRDEKDSAGWEQTAEEEAKVSKKP